MTIPGLASADTNLLDAPPVPVPETSPPPLDPVQETVESVLDPVKDATKPVKDAVKPVTDPVDETVGTVTDEVDKGTTPVTDIVDEPTKPVTDGTGGATTIPPPVSTSGGRPDRSVPLTSADDVTRRRRVHNFEAGVAARSVAPAPAAIDAASRPATTTARAVAAADSVPASTESAAEQIGQAIVDASRAFRFPLLVAAAVLLFLAIQGRVDGRDPKLAYATDDEELMFA